MSLAISKVTPHTDLSPAQVQVGVESIREHMAQHAAATTAHSARRVELVTKASLKLHAGLRDEATWLCVVYQAQGCSMNPIRSGGTSGVLAPCQVREPM